MYNYFSNEENEFIKNNYIKMTAAAIAKELNRDKKAIDNRIHTMRKIGMMQKKHHAVNYNFETVLETQGRQNKEIISLIRGKIIINKYVNLQIKDKKENCEVLFKTFNYFTIKRKNYIESFNFTDIMMGNVSITNA